MAFSGPEQDRVAVGELVASYGDAISLMDFPRWVSLWSEDGVWNHPSLDAPVGKAHFLATVTRMLEPVAAVHFMGILGSLEIQGEEANGRCWVTESIVKADGTAFQLQGLYDDHYVKRGGNWLFQRRSYRIWSHTEVRLGNRTPSPPRRPG